jgi:CRP-like cAMP-binding protein
MPTAKCISSYAYQKLCEIGFSEHYASKFAPRLQILSYKAGDVVWRRGSSISGWSCIINGVVAATINDSETTSVSLGLYGNSAWFGEYSILNNQPSYADYVCLGPTDILSVPCDTVHEVAARDSKFACKLAKLVAWRALKSAETLVLMRVGNPVVRSVMGLYLFSEALAYAGDCPPKVGFEGLNFPFKQAVIASLCGVSRTVVSNCLQKLASQGWVKISYGNIELLNYGAWQRFANRQREKIMFDANPTMDDLLDDLNAVDTFEDSEMSALTDSQPAALCNFGGLAHTESSSTRMLEG